MQYDLNRRDSKPRRKQYDTPTSHYRKKKKSPKNDYVKARATSAHPSYRKRFKQRDSYSSRTTSLDKLIIDYLQKKDLRKSAYQLK